MRSWSVDQNADIDWDEFDTEAYYSHNYRALRNDDRQIVELVRDYFAHAFEVGLLGTGGRGIDVGTGPNPYPALTMLPFCAELTLFERAKSNISWLTRQKEDSWPSWDESWHQFWEVLRGQSVYRRFDEPRNALVDRTRVGARQPVQDENGQGVRCRHDVLRSGVDHRPGVGVPIGDGPLFRRTPPGRAVRGHLHGAFRWLPGR